MIKHVINIGLVLVPFAISSAMDMRTPKELVSVALILAIGLIAMYNGSLKKFKNFWLLLFVIFMWLSACNMPALTSLILSVKKSNAVTLMMTRPISGFWVFKTMFVAFLYLVLCVVTASLDYTKKQAELSIKIMMYCGLAMSLYIFVQYFNLDQFFAQVANSVDPQVKHMTKPKLGGFIGQPTLVSPYIVMLVPIALYFRRYAIALCMAIAVCLTLSEVAIGSMALGVLAYITFSNRKAFKMIGMCCVILIFAGSLYFHQTHPDFKPIRYVANHSSGRFIVWKDILYDFSHNLDDTGRKYCVTGFGPGAFRYMYSIRKQSKWLQAHNEPLEALYNFGLVGMGLLIMAIRYLILNIIRNKTELVWCLSGSLICIFLCSIGTFTFQIAPVMFYTVVIIGMLHNENILGGNYAEI